MYWGPNPGPQTQAYLSEADVLFYGGAAGGGKSDLLEGLALNDHHKSIIFRREYAQLRSLEERLLELIPRRSWNAQTKVAQLGKGHILEFGATQHPGDELKFQGRPHDFIGFDEITHFQKSQVTFLKGWLRLAGSARRDQRTRVVFAGNPPTTQEGEWVISYFRPWLDPTYPNPAKPGEIRYFIMQADGTDLEVPKGHTMVDKEGSVFKAEGRTFIPARLKDNPYLKDTDYGSNLNSMPEPLRSQLLYGDMTLQVIDDPWQLIPTQWVRLAQSRWTKQLCENLELDQIGGDISRGGDDETVFAPRSQNIIGELKCIPGRLTKDSDDVCAEVMKMYPMGQMPLFVYDSVGIGAGITQSLKNMPIRNAAFNGGSKCLYRDKTKQLEFENMRAYSYWLLREALDPDQPNPLILPPDGRLLGDLCAVRWELKGKKVVLRPKDEIKELLHRSPDRGDAVAMALAPSTTAGQGILDFMQQQAAGEAARRAANKAEDAKDHHVIEHKQT